MFSCELGKGRTTTGMAIAALIYCNKKVNYGVILHILSLLCCYIIKPIVTFFFIKSISLSFYRFICDVTRKLLFGALPILCVFMHNSSVFHVPSLGERCVPLPLTCALVRMPFSLAANICPTKLRHLIDNSINGGLDFYFFLVFHETGSLYMYKSSDLMHCTRFIRELIYPA